MLTAFALGLDLQITIIARYRGRVVSRSSLEALAANDARVASASSERRRARRDTEVATRVEQRKVARRAGAMAALSQHRNGSYGCDFSELNFFGRTRREEREGLAAVKDRRAHLRSNQHYTRTHNEQDTRSIAAVVLEEEARERRRRPQAQEVEARGRRWAGDVSLERRFGRGRTACRGCFE